jgi:uncharacterized membrane protein YgcG
MSQRTRATHEVDKSVGAPLRPAEIRGSASMAGSGSQIESAVANPLADSNGQPSGRQPAASRANTARLAIRRKARPEQEAQEAQEAQETPEPSANASMGPDSAAMAARGPEGNALSNGQLELFDALPELNPSTWSSLTATDTDWQLAQASSGPAASNTAAAPAAGAAGTAAGGGSAGALLGVLGAAAIVGAASRGESGSSTVATATPPADTRAPALQSISGSASANTVTLQFDEAIDTARLPATTAFQVRQGPATLAIGRISAEGSIVTLHLSDDLQAGAFSLSYVDPSSGNDINALQDASGNDVNNLMRGIASDGYLFGASIYRDANGDGLPQPSEDTGIKTAVDGSFAWTGPTPDAPLLAAGGINTDTGLPNTLVMSSPVGSGVINPLTTLVRKLMLGGNSSAGASDRLALALGLPAGTDMSQYDPLADRSASGLAAQKVAAQIATLISSAQADAAAQLAVLDRLSTEVRAVADARLANANAATLQLADANLVQALLTTAGSSLNAANLTATLAALASTADFDALAKAQSGALGLSVASNTSGAPSAVIGASKLNLKAGESALLSIAFNEPVQGFDLSDVIVVGGSLADLTALPGGRFFTATLTPKTGSHGDIIVGLGAGSYTNTAGQAGSAASGPSGLRVDGRQPLVDISVATQPLGLSESGNLQGTSVSFAFDEPISSFDTQQVSAINGSLSAWTGSGQNYSATFTPTNGLQSTLAIIRVPGQAFSDQAGHAGIEAGTGFTVDTLPPILNMSSSRASLKIGETATVTMSFSEPVIGLELGDLDAQGRGTLSDFQVIDSRTYRATFTPAANLSSGAEIAVAANAYTDLIGNRGLGDVMLSIQVDNVRPTLSITSNQGTVIGGQTALITFTFSEAVSGFDQSDVAVSNGTISGWSPATGAGQAGKVFTATFTPTPDFAGPSGTISVAADRYLDLAGNAPAAGSSLTLVVDTTAPMVSAISANAASNTITLTFDSALNPNFKPEASSFSVVQGGRTLGIQANGVAIPIPGSNASNTSALVLSVDGDLTDDVFSLTYTPGSLASQRLQDLRGNATESFTRRIVADGYIRGAMIYLDANRDGIAQDSEYTGVTTGLDGSFVLAGMEASALPIIAVGGVNTDTGLPNKLPLTAPAGSLVLNPLTSLVQQVVLKSGNQTDASAAAAKVVQALNLPAGVNLLNYDPLAASGADAVAVQKVAAQLATLAQLAAPNSSADQMRLLQGLAETVSALTPQSAALSLDQSATIGNLLQKAGLTANSQELGTALVQISQITASQGLGAITVAQSQTLDKAAPAAPTIKMVLPSALGVQASVVVDLPTGKLDGSSAAAGDHLKVTLADGQVITHTLQTSDIAASTVTVYLPNAAITEGITAQLIDRAGNASATASSAELGGDTLELSAALAPSLQMMLQSLANMEVPLIGSLDEFANVIWTEISTMLGKIPTARLTARSSGPLPAGGLTLEQLEGSTTYTVDFESYTGGESIVPGGNSAIYDPFGEVTPSFPPDPVDSGSNGGGSSGGGSSGGSSSGGSSSGGSGSGSSTPTAYTRTLVGRSSGTQYNMPELTEFWPGAFQMTPDTGEFRFNYKLPFRLLDIPMLGDLGVDGAYARIDANLGAYASVEIDLQGKLDAKKYLVFDTTKSKLEFYLNAGLSQGSSIGGELGPLTVIGTDMNSAHAPSTAERKNTGLEGKATVTLIDNDGTKNDRLTMSPDTLAKFFNEINAGTFKLSDWYALNASLDGRLSAQLLAQLDLSGLQVDKLTPEQLGDMGFPEFLQGSGAAVTGFLEQITSMLGIFSPQISTKLTVPVTLTYNSADSTKDKADYGKVYFDDIRVGVDTVLTQSVEPGLDMLDQVMSPMYTVEDFLSSPIELWPEDPIDPILGPDDLDSWWPDWTADVVKDVVNAPGNLINSMANTVRGKLDRNSDQEITLFESMRGMVDMYHEMALGLTRFWTAFKSLPGAEEALKAALTTAGLPPTTASAIFDAVASTVTRPAATATDPNPRSPMERVQDALDVTERVLASIDQLQGLRTLYNDALAEVQQYAQGNPDTALSFPLGSYAWDVVNGSFTEIKNAFEKNPIGYVYPPGRDAISESLADQTAAIKLIYETVKAGTASSTTLSPNVFAKAGVDFTQVAAYKDLGFKGVDEFNFDAVCSILNAKKSSVFTTGKDWSSAEYLEKEAKNFTAEFDEIVQYQRLYRITSGQGDYAGWKQSSMGDTFRALGVANDKDYAYKKVYGYDPDFGKYEKTWESGYLYGGEAASYILYDIVDAQLSYKDLDSFAEIQKVWELSRKIEDLGYNLSASPGLRDYEYWLTSGPSKVSRDAYFLSFDDFTKIGLPILSRNEDVREVVNEHFRDWATSWTWDSPAKFNALFDEAAYFVRASNKSYANNDGTGGSSLAKTVISRFMALADVNNGGIAGEDSVKMEDFQTLGITNMSSSWLKLFGELLATEQIQGDKVNTVSNVQKLTNAIQTFMNVVNDQEVDATKFYQTMNLMLGSTRAKNMEFIPRANTGGIDYTYNTEKLPLLQDIMAARDPLEVDTYAEILKLYDITEDILKTSMSDKSVWEVHSLVNSYPKGRDENSDKQFLNYKSKLTAEHLHLLGFDLANSETAKSLATALKEHNVTGRTYWFYNYNTNWATPSKVAELGAPLTLKVLGNLIDDSSQSGFLSELLSKSPLLKKLWDGLHTNGFDTPFLNDPALLQKLWMREPVDFITFDPDLKNLTFQSGPLTLFDTDLVSLAGLGNSWIKAPLRASAEVNVVPRLSFGVDSGGFIELTSIERQNPDELTGTDIFNGIKALLNGFYIRDTYFQGGTWVDLPELDIDMIFSGLLGLQIGDSTKLAEAYGKLSAGFNLGVAVDLANSDQYGKVRLANLIGDLFTDPLEILDLQADLSFFMKAEAGAALRLPKNDGSLLGFLGAAADMVFGANEFKWGPVTAGLDYPIIDNDPTTDAPSLNQLLQSVIG